MDERPYGFGAAEPRGGHGPGRGHGPGGPDFERAWRGFERAFRGFDRGFGPPAFGGPEGPGGPGGPWGRRFGRGDVKYLLLDLLRERPMHGYEMIKELENRHGGRYVPSPGSIYPTLQLLEDRAFVTSTTIDGKRIYTITDAGKAFLDERPEHVKGLWGRPEEWGAGPNFKAAMRQLGPDAWQLGRAFMAVVQTAQGDETRLNSVRAILVRAREELEALQRTPNRGEGGNE
jgi:DNA-binding PadR family transcriptional regulator